MEDDLQSLLHQLDEQKPTQVISIKPEVGPKSDIITAEQVEDKVDPTKYLNTLDIVTSEVLDACRADRKEAQDIINSFRNQINRAIEENSAPTRMYVDGLVKALEVKTNINSTAVKMMETNAKMLAAMKVTGPNVQINNLNSSTAENDSALEGILNQPLTNEDEY